MFKKFKLVEIIEHPLKIIIKKIDNLTIISLK